VAERLSAVDQSEFFLRSAPSIERIATAVTAFVGRTLKGPVNRPVRVESFVQFQQLFGGLWQPSTVSYAVEQFFDNGGRQALIVRVTNCGRPPTISLPTPTGALRLRGRSAGTREYLRASVDYDGISVVDAERFNLVIQRVRAPGSEFIEDQEIFRGVSVRSGTDRYVADVLINSVLARVVEPVIGERPDRTRGPGPGSVVGYIASAADGDDGDELTDYDLIGSAEAGSGLFALEGAPEFNLLCLPPLSRERDVGLPALLVAARLCRRRQAMLLIDPPAAWSSVSEAMAGLRGWPLHSEDALMYFPRILAQDRLRGRPEIFAASAAAAGMLARSDESCPVWSPLAADDPVLRPGLRPALELTAEERLRLSRLGANSLLSARSPVRLNYGACTLLPDEGARSEGRDLAARRCTLCVTGSVLRGTRWTVLEPAGPALWQRARTQVAAFLESLDQEGAFVGGTAAESYFVICDERLNKPNAAGKVRFDLLFGIALRQPGEFQCFLVTHTPGESRIRPVMVNHLAMPWERLEERIETTILRGLTAEG
jgi:phage tail sheath protein FI